MCLIGTSKLQAWRFWVVGCGKSLIYRINNLAWWVKTTSLTTGLLRFRSQWRQTGSINQPTQYIYPRNDSNLGVWIPKVPRHCEEHSDVAIQRGKCIVVGCSKSMIYRINNLVWWVRTTSLTTGLLRFRSQWRQSGSLNLSAQYIYPRNDGNLGV